MFYFVCLGVIAVIALVSLWKIFVKAGQPGWAAIVPIYNYLVLLRIVGRPWWWILIMLVGVIPVVGWIVTFAVGIIILNDLAKSFGKGPGVTVLLVLLPFIGYPYLAFGDAKYHGPAALNTPGGMTGPTPAHSDGAHPKV
ncbi:MAG: DUF5684 domain-containing protein [Candidatus Saccharimonadales bacterium]